MKNCSRFIVEEEQDSVTIKNMYNCPEYHLLEWKKPFQHLYYPSARNKSFFCAKIFFSGSVQNFFFYLEKF